MRRQEGREVGERNRKKDSTTSEREAWERMVWEKEVGQIGIVSDRGQCSMVKNDEGMIDKGRSDDVKATRSESGSR